MLVIAMYCHHYSMALLRECMMRQDPSKLWLPDIGYSLACGLVIAPYITSIAAFTPIKGWFAGSYGLTKKFSAMGHSLLIFQPRVCLLLAPGMCVFTDHRIQTKSKSWSNNSGLAIGCTSLTKPPGSKS